MHQEIRLQAVVVEVGRPEFYTDFCAEMQSHLGPLQFTNYSDLDHRFQNSFVRPADLVPHLASQTSLKNSYERVRRLLGLNLHYVFSDGRVVDWNQIIYHPLANSLHPDLLPLRKGIYEKDFAFEDYLWTRDFQRVKLEFGEVEYLFLRILKNLQKMIANRRLDLFVSTETSPKLVQVKFVRFEKDLECCDQGLVSLQNELISEADHLQVHIRMAVAADIDFYKNFYVDHKQQIFVFHRISGLFNQLATRLLQESLVEEVGIDENQALIDQKQLSFRVQSPDRALALFHFLRGPLAERYRIHIGFEHEEIRVGEAAQSGHLYFSRDGKLSLSFSYSWQEQTQQVFNFPAWMQVLCVGFDRGFRSSFDNFGIEYVPKGMRKSIDTKITKHLGIFYYFVFESLQHFLLGRSSDGQLRDDVAAFDFLFTNLQRYYQSSEPGAETETYGLFCSKSLQDAMQRFFVLIGEKSRQDLRLLVGGKELVLESLNRRYLRILLELLQAPVIASGGDCFLKARTNYSCFEFTRNETEEIVSEQAWELRLLSERNLGEVDRYPLYCKGLKRSLVISELFSLHAEGWKIYVDGVDVSILSEQDFNWQFELAESREPAEALVGRQKMDWFELHPKFFLKGQEIDFELARKLSQGEWIQHNGQYFILANAEMPSVKILEKFWDRIANKKVKQAAKGQERAYFEVEKSMSLELLALRSIGVEVKGGEEWQRITQFFDRLQNDERPAEVSASLRQRMKPYQEKGLRWLQDLYELRLGGILADDMGLGKTLQALAFLQSLQEKKELGLALVLVPTSLVYNWISEAAKFTPELEFINFNSKEKAQIAERLQKTDHAVLISTYGLFTEHEEFFQDFTWNIHIFDEAQNLKNIITKRTTAARKLDANFKLCLTGTPLENHLGEFYSLLDLCVPGSLGSYEDFKKLYVSPFHIDKEDIRFLKLKARPLVMRRTKKEILTELPDKTVSIIKIPFSDEQKRIYRDVALSWNEKVKASIAEVGEAKSQMIMLTALLRLRQVCSDPAALPGVSYKENPPKIQLLSETLESITEAGESAIVFTQFIHSLERIITNLRQRGIKVFTMDGRSSKAKREEILRGFEEEVAGAVLVMTLKTGGVGLNLTKASYVFHLEPWWNPAVEDQATDRVHRLGQKNAVQVYRYLMEESVEEKIEKLKERKSSYFKSLFDVENPDEAQLSTGGGLTREDFEYLLG